eukprot:TRINITY_DN10333_c0_g1_i1.p1 TRINITY_DN10333_c0_g1~~TRINITY_DN10333_c0_g1_i1.p1  ORF type:complete len:1103 (-),score=194.28 TRINITY_DN10333_c0_g1_i1:147-3344(-)
MAAANFGAAEGEGEGGDAWGSSDTLAVQIGRLDERCSALAQSLTEGNLEGAASAASFLARRRASLRLSPPSDSAPSPLSVGECLTKETSEAPSAASSSNVAPNAGGARLFRRMTAQPVGIVRKEVDRIESAVTEKISEDPQVPAEATKKDTSQAGAPSDTPTGESTASSDMPKFATGADVEYFSQSFGGWVMAVVQGFDESSGTYSLNIHPQALPQKIRLPSRATTCASSASETLITSESVAGDAPSPAAVDASVELPSAAPREPAGVNASSAGAPKDESRQQDDQPRIQRRQTAAPEGGLRNAAEAAVGAAAAPAAANANPFASPAGQPAQAASSSGRQYPDGAAVEYFSTTHGGWVPAVMLGYNDKTGAYKLDIQPIALPSKVRAAPSSGAGATPPVAVASPAVAAQQAAPFHGVSPSNPFADPPAAGPSLNPFAETASADRRPRRPCGVCQASFLVDELLGPQCDHLFCSSCLRRHVVELDFVRERVPCPAGCGVDMTPLQVRHVVGEDAFAERQAAMAREDEELARRFLEDDQNEERKRQQKQQQQQQHQQKQQQPERGPHPLASALQPVVNAFSRKPQNLSRGSAGGYGGGSGRRDVEAPKQAEAGEFDWVRQELLRSAEQRGERFVEAVNRGGNSSGLSAGSGATGPSPVPVVAAQQQASRPPPPTPEQPQQQRRQPCSICSKGFIEDELSGPACGHLFCSTCFRGHIVANDFIREAVKCPQFGCGESVDHSQIRFLVGADEYARRQAEIDEQAAQALHDEFAREQAQEKARNAPEFDCPLCFEKGNLSDAIELDCDHKLCTECFQNYLNSKIMEAQVAEDELVCPIPKCKKEITVAQVEGATAGTALWDKFLQFRMNMWKPSSDEGDIVECPTSKCGKFLVPAKMEVVQCPVCNLEFCPKCCGKSHKGVTCEAHRKWQNENDNVDTAFQELMEREQWRRCPVCSAPSERESGCNFMQCRSEKCRKRTYWCYICGLQKVRDDHYKHYPKGPYEDECHTPMEERVHINAPAGAGAMGGPIVGITNAATVAADAATAAVEAGGNILGALHGWIGQQVRPAN